MKSLMISCVIALLMVALVGCQMTGELEFGIEIRKEQAPPEVTGGGGERKTTTIKATGKLCLP